MKFDLPGEKALRVQINGETRELADGSSLEDLVSELALAPERVAIELNQHVVRRSDWPGTQLADGDRIEIVHFVGGGSGAISSRGGFRFVGFGCKLKESTGMCPGS